MTKVATYDNPVTLRREAWRDGKLVAFINMLVLVELEDKGHSLLPFYLNVGPWEKGKIRGDKEAINE